MADVNSAAPEQAADTAVMDSTARAEPAPLSPSPTAPAVLADDLVGLARAAAAEEAGGESRVGDYLGARSEDDVATSASFAATDRGYRGWFWLVTVAVVDPLRPTISEVVLLPGDEALLAPAWVPWDQRVRAGDLGVGDLLPTTSEDPRLVPGHLDSDDPAVKEVDYEFGFGRARVLGREGRDEAAQRWHDGSFGPEDAMAQQAPASCGTCGFYTRLEGLLGQSFGACANEFSPADGRVVDAGYGCGAHSEVVIDAPLISASTAAVMDELTLEVHRRPTPSAQAEAPAEADPLVDAPDPEADAPAEPGAVTDALAPEADAPVDSVEPFEPAGPVAAAEPIRAEPAEVVGPEAVSAPEALAVAEPVAVAVAEASGPEPVGPTDDPDAVATETVATDLDATGAVGPDAAGDPSSGPDAG